MNQTEIASKITEEKPQVVHVSGKTCTGKTTFASALEEQGYLKIELDKIVTDSVVVPFNVLSGDAFLAAYRDEGPSEQTEAFIVAARKEISTKMTTSPLVIEGSIAKTRILKEVFKGHVEDFVFIYFHPVNIETYIERIRARFVAGARKKTAGLPKHFWAHVQEADFKEFLDMDILNEGIENSIRNFASASMQESNERLNHLKTGFPDICVVEV